MKKYISAAVAFSLLLSIPASLFAQTTPPAPPLVCTSLVSNLGLGSNNAAVMDLQNFLRAQGFLGAQATGYFGSLTAAAVMNFQASQGLPQVGSVGPMTRAAIQTVSCAPQTSTAIPSTAPAVVTTTTPPAATSTTSAATSTAATSTTPTLPFKADRFENWQTTWGDVSTTTTGSLLLQGTLDTNGAEAVFPASAGWSDYKFTANVSVSNSNITLMARYVDENNFVACSFSKDWVQITQRSMGTTTILASKYVPGVLDTVAAAISTAVSMDVKGHTIGCAALGPEDNLTYTLRGVEPLTGAIGIQTYYDTPLAARLELLSIKVDPL